MKHLVVAFFVLLGLIGQPAAAEPVFLNCKDSVKNCRQRVYDALVTAGCQPYKFLFCDGPYDLERRCFYETHNCHFQKKYPDSVGGPSCRPKFPNRVEVKNIDRKLFVNPEKKGIFEYKHNFICKK